MARNAQGLQVIVIVCATSCDVDDVVNLKVCAYVSALLAGVPVTQQDSVTDATPGPATAAAAPCVGLAIGYAGKLPRLSHLDARLDGGQPTHKESHPCRSWAHAAHRLHPHRP